MRTSRLWLAFLTAGLVSTALFAACDSNTSAPASVAATEAAPSAMDAEPIFTGEPPEKAGAFVGDVAVRTVDKRRVVVSLDEAPTDGRVDRVFTLQTEAPFARPISFDASEASITLLHGNLFVDAGAETVHLQTNGFDVAEGIAERRLPALGYDLAKALDLEAPRRTLVGIGLAQKVVDPGTGLTLADARSTTAYVAVGESCASSLPFKSLLPAGTTGVERQNCGNGYCPGGGPGSTGCGAGGCDVTCGNGYHACCDGATCTCCSN